MGAHGIRPWEDDDGADWIADLPGTGARALAEALARAQSAGYLECPEASAAVAAAEVVAAAIGRPCDDLPDELLAWIAQASPAVADAEVTSAVAALDRVTATSDSELHDLWADTPAGNAWLASIADLRDRLLGRP